MVVSNPKPPDGGWGWVIVICGFTNHFFTVGVMMSLSVFYVSWLDQFGESKGATSWILSIGAACMFGLCPIPASLAVRFGFRTVAFIGGLLTSLGLVLSVFASSVTYLVVSIGLITGIGWCFCYLPALATVAMYFDRRRSLAMGLNAAGAGIGAFVLSPLLNLLEEMYGWRGALLLLAGITLHMCVTGLLMRDLWTDSEDELMADYSLVESDMAEERNATSDGLVKDDNHKVDLDTSPMIKVTYCEDGNIIEDRVSLQHLKTNSALKSEDPFKNNEHRLHASHGDLRKNLLQVNENDHSHSFPSLEARTIDRKCKHRSKTSVIKNMDLALLSSVPSLLKDKEMLGASSCQDSSVTSDEITVRDQSVGKRTFVSMLLSSKTVKANLELLSDKTHVAFCVSNFIANLSCIAPAVFMVDRAVYKGISKSAGAFFVSAIGIGQLVGRIFFGFMADRCHTRHICMYITALIVCGVGTMLSDLCGDIFILHAAYAAFFGFQIGTYTVLAPIVCVDLKGVAVFPTAYGQVSFFMGTGGIFGPPLAGWLFDWTRSYTLSYLSIGFILIVSGVIQLPLLCRNRKTPPTMR